MPGLPRRISISRPLLRYGSEYRPLLRLVESPRASPPRKRTTASRHLRPLGVPTATRTTFRRRRCPCSSGRHCSAKTTTRSVRCTAKTSTAPHTNSGWAPSQQAGTSARSGRTCSSWGLAVAGPIYLAYNSTRALCRRYPWQAVALVFLCIGLALTAYVPASRWQRIGQARGGFSSRPFCFPVEAVALEGTARAQFESLTAPKPALPDVVAEIGETRALTRKCLYELRPIPGQRPNGRGSEDTA